MKKTTIFARIILSLLLVTGLLIIGLAVCNAQTRDSLVTVSVSHDSTYTVRVTTTAKHDSTYVVKVPVIVPTTTFLEKHYLNNISAWYYSANTQDAVIKWLIDNKQNVAEIYGVDGAITSTANWKWISRFNDICSAHNIQTSFIWSTSKSVTVDLDKFQKAQTRQSAKFDRVKNESEPYNNTVSYQLWWQYSREVFNWAVKNGLPSDVYIGWHTQQSYDSIRVLYHNIDAHIYLQSSAMSNPKSLYDYLGPRLEMISKTPGTFNFGPINSNETAFAYTYYNSIKDFTVPATTFQAGFNQYASAKVKSQAKYVSHETFVSKYSWQIKPLPVSSAARMAMREEPVRKVLYVNPKTGKISMLKTKTLGQIKAAQVE